MKLQLPQGNYLFRPGLVSPVLLVAGGRPPSAEWLRVAATSMPVWAVDKGIESCRRATVKVERVVGDADSGAAEDWEWAVAQGVPAEHFPRDKDDTDLQLTLKELGRRRPGASVFIAGGLGGRFDHAYTNVCSLFQSREWGLHPVGLVGESEAIFLLDGESSLNAFFFRPPIVVSLLPFSETCRGVTMTGTHWPLEHADLHSFKPSAICNRLHTGEETVAVSLVEGRLGVYFCWDEQAL